MKGDAEHALAACVAAHVTKPIDRSTLSRFVDEQLAARTE
jgi:hypothetical protein